MTAQTKSRWRAFWDWFVLFSGISTASNLSRTRPDPVRRREMVGRFLAFYRLVPTSLFPWFLGPSVPASL